MRKKYKLKFQKTQLPTPQDKKIEEKYNIMLREAHGLFIEKNNAYRSVFLEFGVEGIFVRIKDKLTRLLSDAKSVSDEDLTENFLDIVNYGVMGAMTSYYNLKKVQGCGHLFKIKEETKKTIKLKCIKCNKEVKAFIRSYLK